MFDAHFLTTNETLSASTKQKQLRPSWYSDLECLGLFHKLGLGELMVNLFRHIHGVTSSKKGEGAALSSPPGEQNTRDRVHENARAVNLRGQWHSQVRTLHMHTYCLLYTSPSPRDATLSRMPSSA